jgi:hypothetical protein
MSEKPNAPYQIDDVIKNTAFVAPPSEEFFELLDRVIEGEPEEISSVAIVFKNNLKNAMDTAGMPFYLIGMDARYTVSTLHMMLTGENINFDDGNDVEIQAVLKRWGALASREDVYPSLIEHLRQSTVLLWGTFEAFSKDLFVTLLNAKPDLTEKLLENQGMKRKFDLKYLQFDELIEYGYNLSTKMGSILSKRTPINSFITIKEIFATILPNNDLLNETLNDKHLGILNQRRHLIVHKRAIIDDEYLNNTGEQLEKESYLIVTPQDFNSYLYSVLAAGTVMVYQAKNLFVPQTFKLIKLAL